MYEVIEKNKYGVLVKENKPIISCYHCKYGKNVCENIDCKGVSTYYLTNQEAAKLENEITAKDFFEVKSTKDKSLLKEFEKMINNPDNSLADAYAKKTEAEMQVFYDSQKELVNLQIENKKLKERIKELKDKYECNESCPSFGYQCNINELFKDCNKHRN